MPAVHLNGPPKLDFRRDALFVDLDGTIAEIADLPRNVGPQKQRNTLLENLGQVLGDRIAVLTGRTLEEADRILGGAVVAVAAVHGLILRNAMGVINAVPPAPGLTDIREELAPLLRKFPNLVLEEKGASLAVHFRQSPMAAMVVHETIMRIAKSRGLIVQDGAMVSELRTPGPDKGDALRTFMNEVPFSGSIPVMVGDDLTDESGFEAAQSLGGYGVLVGAPRSTHARYRLGSVDDVMSWLRAGLA